MKIAQSDLVKEFFANNPNRDIQHQESVDWLTKEYSKRTGDVFRDPDRAIRKLAQQGFLIKVAKGVYRHEPDSVFSRKLADFSEQQKNAIKKRDKYKCVVCGKGIKEGIELHVDHIKPKELGGMAVIENGQTLCAQHNFQKKTLKQTETGKMMFIRLYELAKKNGNVEVQRFCEKVLKVYEKCNINGHIKWQR